VAILVATVASGSLTWQHLSGRPLPGCGGGKAAVIGALQDATHVSACASLEVHPMGSLGGMKAWLEARRKGETFEKVSPEQAKWPVSLLGFSYFAAALVAWVVVGVQGRTIGAPARAVVWLGGLASVAYVVTIVVSNKLCPYCIASHAGNLALVTLMEVGMRTRKTGMGGAGGAGGVRRNRWAAVLAGLVTFGGVAGVLNAKENVRHAEIVAEANRELDETRAALNAQIEAAKTAAAAPAPEKLPWGDNGFTGRWLLGPKEAQARVVMLISYQCPDCNLFEQRAMALLDQHKGKVSLSVMHYPMCTDCNKYVRENHHPDACLASYIAEAAAIVGGSRAALEGGDQAAAANEAFWRMHRWLIGLRLFDRKERFDLEELKKALPGLGFPDVEQFVKVVQGPAVKKIVEGDVEIGEALGLYYTPMMFVNGVEVRGWLTNPMALNEAVNTVISASPPAQTARSDRPDLAQEKCVQDWVRSPKMTINTRADRTKGPADAKVSVVVLGDYTEPNTKKVDELVRGLQGSKPFRYTFMHYPGAKECNPGLPRDFFVSGCLAARAAEAAGIVGGPDAFWTMHEFLFQNASGMNAQRVALGAGLIGLEDAKFNEAMTDGRARQAVEMEVASAKALGLRAIPTVFVNGKLVERWEYKGFPVLENVIDRAVREAQGGGTGAAPAPGADKK
jgi:protein-disulfide isomerase